MGSFEFDGGTISMIINTIITLLGVFGIGLGVVWKVTKAIKESGDVLTVAGRIFEDKKVTPEEVDEFIKELNEAKGAWQDVRAQKAG